MMATKMTASSLKENLSVIFYYGIIIYFYMKFKGLFLLKLTVFSKENFYY